MKQNLADIMRTYDNNNSGYLSFNDYMKIMTEKIAARDPLEEIKLAFKLFDEDNSGYITKDKLKRVAIHLGEDLNDEELKSMIDEFDRNCDGMSK